MNLGKFVFTQLLNLIHPEQFRRCVKRYQGNHKVKTFCCWDQFVCMATGKSSSIVNIELMREIHPVMLDTQFKKA